MPVKVNEKDKGWEKLKQELARGGLFKVKVGWPAERSGSHGGLSSAELATIHEFGSPRRGIPERPVLRQTFEANRAQLEQLMARQTQLVLDGKATLLKAMDTIGAWFAARLQGRLRKGNLVDTGQLRSAVAWVVIKA